MALGCDTQGIMGQWEPAQKGLVITPMWSHSSEIPRQTYITLLS